MHERRLVQVPAIALAAGIGGSLLAGCSPSEQATVCPTVTLQPAYPEYGNRTGVGVALEDSLQKVEQKRGVTATTGAHDTIIQVQRELDHAHKKYDEPQAGDTFVYCIRGGEISSGHHVTVVGEK